MPTRTSYAHGTPSWVDLSTTDPDAAREFYAALFGWSYQTNPVPDGGEYIMAMQGENAAAAMMQQAPEQAEMGLPPMWNTYVSVDDLAATVAKVEAAGGNVMMAPMRVMDAGQMAVIVDPTGAVLCLWEANEHAGAGVVNEHGALCWNEVMTDDVAGAAAFYSELLGWGTQKMDMGEGPPYTVFTVGEDGVAGAMAPPVAEIPNHWGTVFAVDSCDAAAETAKANGGTILAEPFETPIGRISAIADPQGAAFQVIQLNESAAGG